MLDDSSKSGAALRRDLPEGTAPALTALFSVGQYVRCCVISLPTDTEQQQGQQQGEGQQGGSGRKSKVAGLSLRLKKVVGGAGVEALQKGQVVPVCVKTVEDHGYTCTFGMKVRGGGVAGGGGGSGPAQEDSGAEGGKEG